jgi:hypothetical protein
MTTKTIKKKRNSSARKYKFMPEMTFLVYDMVKQGQTREAISNRLGIPLHVYKVWMKNNPAIAMAVAQGKVRLEEMNRGHEALDEYILGRLPPHLKPFWDECQSCYRNGDPIPMSVTTLEVNERQILFLTAWMRFKFSTAKALRFTGLKRDTVNNWMTSPRFKKMMAELQEAKRDFYEDALIGCVLRGETPAIIFANKTINKDRGYGESKDVTVKGEIAHNHEHTHLIDLDALNLPIEVQAAIAEAMEKRKKFDEDVASRNLTLSKDIIEI